MEESSCFLCENWQYILSFLTAVGVTIYTAKTAKENARYSRETAKKKNSTDLLMHARVDTDLTRHLRTIFEIDVNENVDIKSFATKAKANDEEAKAIRYVLNHWEYVSVGINNGIYHENIIKESSYTTLCTLYDITKTYISQINKVERKKTIYQEVRCLAKRWEDDPLPEKKPK